MNPEFSYRSPLIWIKSPGHGWLRLLGMEWILHHWPTLWMFYEPATVRIFIAVTVPFLLLAAPSAVSRRV